MPNCTVYDDIPQGFIVQIVTLACTLIRAAILLHIVDKELQWPHYSSTKQYSIDEIISFWLPHCIRLIQSMYSSLITMEMSCESLDLIAKLLLDLR